MDLVIDDQSPVLGVEHGEMLLHAVRLRDQHLIRGDGDRPDLLALARVLADIFWPQRRAGEQFAFPLVHRDGVRNENQSGRLGLHHRRHADDRLSGTAGQHDDAGPTGPERVRRVLLVGTDDESVLVFLRGLQRHRERRAVDVSRLVVGGPARLDQRLFETAAIGRLHLDEGRSDGVTQEGRHGLGPADLGEHGVVGGAQHHAEERIVLDDQPAVATHRVDDVDQQRLRHVVAGVGEEGIDALLGVVARRPSVPQRERSDAVRVDVFRCLLQLGERRNGLAARRRVFMADLEQQRPVALDDQRATGHRW